MHRGSSADQTKLLWFETTEFDAKEVVHEVVNNGNNLPHLKVENGFIFKRKRNPNIGDELLEMEWKLWMPQNLTHTVVIGARLDPTWNNKYSGDPVTTLLLAMYDHQCRHHQRKDRGDHNEFSGERSFLKVLCP